MFEGMYDENALARSDATGDVEAKLSSAKGMSFPSDLGSRSVQFQIKTRERVKQRSPVGFGAGSLIALPIPANLSTGYGAVYGQDGLGVLGSAASGMVQRGLNSDQAVKEFRDNGVNMITEQAKAIAASASQEVAGALGAAFAQNATSGLGLAGITAGLAGIGVGALRGAGLAVNPHLAVLFEGMGFRNHTFNYKFSARDAGESASLYDIIKTFKIAMHPTADAGAFFEYPDEFIISFPRNQYLFEIGTSVLTSFNIDYTPDGGSYFHENGAPVSVSMSLQFTELDILTQAEIGEGR